MQVNKQQKELEHGTTDWFNIGQGVRQGTMLSPCLFNFYAEFVLLFSLLNVSNSLQSHGLQHTRLPCPSLSPRDCSKSPSLSQWGQSTISSSVVPIFSCFQSFPALGSFLMNWPFTSGSQSIGASASASVLLMNIQDWFPLGLSGLISLQSKGLSRVMQST